MDLRRAGRAATVIVLTLACLFYLQFGLQALAHHLGQGVLSLVGAFALGFGTVRHARGQPAAPAVLLGTLPVLILHAVMTLEDPGELPFLVGSAPAPFIAGVAWLSTSATRRPPRSTSSTRSNRNLSVESSENAYVPVTFDRCHHVAGPFFHGTKVAFAVGDEIEPGHVSNFHEGRISNHVYFAALLEPAVWGAELAVALTGSEVRGRIYVVEPTGPFEDDPNVTNKKFPGNVTQSYRTPHALRVISEVHDWEGHAPEVLQGMLDNIARLREQGLDVIED